MSKELLTRALQRIVKDNPNPTPGVADLCKEIETELAKPDPEPVAWMYDYKDPINPAPTLDHVTALQRKINHVCVLNVRPLYTTPPNQSARISELERELSVERGQVKLLRERLNVRFNEGLRMGHADSERAIKSAQEAKDRFYSENEILTNQIEQLEQQLATLQPLADKIKQQKEQDHDAPCAGACEAKAFYIEIRQLKAKIETLQTKQDPVAWYCPEDPESCTAFHWEPGICSDCGVELQPLYAKPQQPNRDSCTLVPTDQLKEMQRKLKPLSRELLTELAQQANKEIDTYYEFARAIERAHGIGDLP